MPRFSQTHYLFCVINSFVAAVAFGGVDGDAGFHRRFGVGGTLFEVEVEVFEVGAFGGHFDDLKILLLYKILLASSF